ncbi:restriction endonuclease subunit S [Thermoflavimicrobium daqui]|uniref:Type I restriction modification DNA specificity domain-containing protein n=1 Tax=Thermoflavimicrobium daqui TaxID=2137476 RepID=A0A364K9H6_9BACL|nr:restriction endonuclease subunit S [Thermoflavimicrobium daqui]RAL26956.1 hypothetical protein DL897_02620 [Thermoflavimicrobium daqui]
MNLVHIISYEQILKKDDWTVSSLVFDQEQNEHRTILLSDLVDINTESLPSKDLLKGHKYQYVELSSVNVDMGMIESTKLVDPNDLPARARLFARKDDIILSLVRPERGAVAIIPEQLDGCIVSSGFAVLRPKEFCAELIYFLLRHPKVLNELGKLATGTIASLKLKQIKDYNLPFLSLSLLQEKKAKELYQQLLACYQKRKSLSAVVEEVFEQKLLIREKKQDKRSLIKVLAYEELSGRLDVAHYLAEDISVEWKCIQVPLKELVKVGMSVPVGRNDLSNKGIPYIRPSNLSDETIHLIAQEPVYVPENIVYDSKGRVLQTGDILVLRIGGTLGRSALITKEWNGSIANSNMWVLTPDQTTLSSEYLAYYFKTRWVHQTFAIWKTGDTLPQLRANDLKEMVIPVPEMKIQKEIVALINERINGEEDHCVVNNIKHFFVSLSHKDMI